MGAYLDRNEAPPLHEVSLQVIEVPSAVPAPLWKELRAWLEDLGHDYEPNLHQEHGLLGYAVKMRNWLVGVGLSARQSGPALSLTAVLCRGMDREAAALHAVDKANARLQLGQLLYFPGPPAEISFYASIPFDLIDQETFRGLFAAMQQQLTDVGFPAVMAVRGYHPTDYAAPWGDPMLAPIDDDDFDLPDADPEPLQAKVPADACPADPAPPADAPPIDAGPARPRRTRKAR